MAVKVDLLRKMYMDIKDKMVKEEEVLKDDITPQFWFTIRDKIRNREVVNISIRGEVRTGKSTVGLAIQWRMNNILKELDLFLRMSDERLVTEKEEDVIKRRENLNYGNLIQSDQTEFIRFIGKEFENVAITIDEWNRMGKTGANATTEEALYDYYSDVFAGKYVHRISSSPADVVDNNTTIVLDIIGRDNEKGITMCKVIYRDIINMRMKTLGHIVIDVKEILNMEFYINYKEKKFKRMELLDKHGVRDIRELEFAEIVLESLYELEDVSEAGKVTSVLAMTIVDEVRRRKKAIYSLVAMSEITNKVLAITNIVWECSKFKKKLRKETNSNNIEILRRAYGKLVKIKDKRIKEQAKLKEVYRIYKEIGNGVVKK